MSLIKNWIGFGFVSVFLGCSPAVMLPPVQEPLNSVAWENCAANAKEREESSLIDDLTLDSKSLLCKGVVLANNPKQVDEGLELLTEAAVKDKSDFRPYFLSGRILTYAGRYEEALSAFVKANKRNAQMEVPTVRLAKMVIDNQSDEEAILFLKKANQRNFCKYYCKGMLANLYHTDDIEKAKTLYDEMIEEDNTLPDAYMGLARIENKNTNFEKEEQLLNQAIEVDGFDELPKENQGQLFYRLGFAQYNLKKYSSAKLNIEKAVQVEFRADWLVLAGWIHLKNDDPAMAQIQFEKAIDIDDKFADAYVGKGDCAMVLRQYGEAISAYKKATYNAPTDGQFKLKLAKAYIAKSDFKNAQIQFDDAVKLGKENLTKSMLQEVQDALSEHTSEQND